MVVVIQDDDHYGNSDTDGDEVAMVGEIHQITLTQLINEYAKKGYMLRSLNTIVYEGYRPDAVVENDYEVVIIEVVISSDRSDKFDKEKLEKIFHKKTRLHVIGKQEFKGMSLRIPEELHSQLRIFCMFTDKKKSDVVREFIKRGLTKSSIIWIREWLKKRPKNRLKICEKCGSRDDVRAYHIDGNVRNDDEENIIYLCRFCFNKLVKYIQKYDPTEKFAEWFRLEN